MDHSHFRTHALSFPVNPIDNLPPKSQKEQEPSLVVTIILN